MTPDTKQEIDLLAAPRELTISISLVVDGAEISVTTLDSMLLQDIFAIAVHNFDEYILKG